MCTSVNLKGSFWFSFRIFLTGDFFTLFQSLTDTASVFLVLLSTTHKTNKTIHLRNAIENAKKVTPQNLFINLSYEVFLSLKRCNTDYKKQFLRGFQLYFHLNWIFLGIICSHKKKCTLCVSNGIGVQIYNGHKLTQVECFLHSRRLI